MSSPSSLPPPLTRPGMDPDPHAQFARWFGEARAAGVHEPEAMALATAAADGTPSVRMLLLRGFGPDGYVWFTNYLSPKGRDLDANPVAAIAIHWADMGRQVRISGPVSRTTAEESDAYFAGRPRESQVGAWASNQSAPVADRAALDAAVDAAAARFADGPVPRPPHWGGYRMLAASFEFWQHRPGRLHDRIRYTPDASGTWEMTRLAP